MGTYRKIINYISWFLREFVMVVLGAMVLFNFLEILRRLIFIKSFLWVQELSTILVVWLVFIGAAHYYIDTDLLSVDFLYIKAKGIVRLVWGICIYAVELFVLYVFIIQSYKYALKLLPSLTNAMRVSMAWYAIPMVISSIVMALGTVIKIYDLVVEYKKYSTGKKEEVLING